MFRYSYIGKLWEAALTAQIVYPMLMIYMQCSPQADFKAQMEIEIWVEPLATSKLTFLPFPHQGKSIKAYGDLYCTSVILGNISAILVKLGWAKF